VLPPVDTSKLTSEDVDDLTIRVRELMPEELIKINGKSELKPVQVL
jgi:hypothetical protein